MVSFPDFSNLSSNPDIGDLLSLPNASYPYFWAWIIASIWFIITSTLYFKGKERMGKEKLLSCMAVATFPIIVLSVIGTIVGFITLNIMIYIIVISFVIIGIWFFSD